MTVNDDTEPTFAPHKSNTNTTTMESETDDEQQLLAGWATHTLVDTPAGLRIRLKRVDLVNSDAAFGNLQLFV